MQQYDVPFFSNTPDGTHCFQASMRSILKYFLPEREFEWTELEQMSAKKSGLSTWPTQMLMNLNSMGFEVILIEGFNVRDFIKKGSEYLNKEFGQEVASWQIKNSDVPQEQTLYSKLLKSDVKLLQNIPTQEDIKKYLSENYLLSCMLNSRRLNHKPGYVGHSITIIDQDSKGFIIHDPGLPPQKNRHVSFEDFEAAWADPNKQAKSLIAIKPKMKGSK